MIQRLLFCLICILPYSAFGQTCGTGHCPQPNDEIARHAINMSDAGLPGRNVTWSLADMRGIVYRTASHVGCTEGTLALDYGGLSRGQYIVYIYNGMNVYAEKFNNK